MELFTAQELNAFVALLSRIPMSPAEQLFVQGFVNRLVAFCQPPKPPEPEPEEVIKPHPALGDDLAMAEVQDDN